MSIEEKFNALKSYVKRQFVKSDANLENLEEIKQYFKTLNDQVISSVEEFEQWILDRSEFEAALFQVSSVLYIKMTCQTDNKVFSNAYTNFIQNVYPATKALGDQLNQKFKDLSEKFQLDKDRYEIYAQAINSDLELFVEKNVALQTEDDLLSQEYQEVCGAMTVEFEGKERTLPEMSKYLLEIDRDLRERAWKATAERRFQEKEKLDEIFSKMVKLRHQQALNAGFKNYMEYKFKALHRFDYTSEDCKAYHDAVEKVVIPICCEMLKRRKIDMKLDVLRPWDLAVDPLNQAPLKPFEKVDELIGGCQKIFSKVDAELSEKFSNLAASGLLDLESRKGKAPGGYQSSLDEARAPFIFMNAVGVDQDVRTLLHESGHAFHSMLCASDPLLDYRHGPMEFNEVASMAMELLGGEFIAEFYNENDARRSSYEHLEDAISVLGWVATVDAFQHWIYENPDHTKEQRKEEWLNLQKRFGTGEVDWSGYEDMLAYAWHRQLHIFEVPFYYIEYGIAQLGAFQVWANSKKDKGTTLQQYKTALSLGGSKSLSTLFEAAGIKFDFSEDTIAPLMTMVNKELELLK